MADSVRSESSQPDTTLERLRVFHAISRVGSVAGAARRLDYTPSAVSQHLAALEREVGVALVERSNRGVELTEAGRKLAGRASEVLDLVANSLEETRAAAGDPSSSLTIAAFPSAITTILIPVRARLRPTTHVRIIDAEAEEALLALRSRSVDIAITDGHAHDQPRASDDLHRIVLRTEPVRLVTRSDRTGQRLPDFADHPWVLGRSDGRLGAGARQVCAEAGFRPDIIAETDDHHVAFELVQAEGAVTLLPELALGDLPAGLTLPPIDIPMERRVEFVTRMPRRESPAVVELANLVADHLSSNRFEPAGGR